MQAAFSSRFERSKEAEARGAQKPANVHDEPGLAHAMLPYSHPLTGPYFMAATGVL